MKTTFPALLLLAPLTCPAQEEIPPAPDNHQDFAQAVLQFLSDTEICLNTCVDTTTTQAAIPQLKALAERAKNLSALQRELDEPSLQDHIAMQQHVKRFNTLWSAIRRHLSRLETQGLITPELRDILRIAPTTTEAPGNTPAAPEQPDAPTAQQP